MISVVVTNFNYGRFLGRCIRSILAQSIERKLYEVIVVDDASTDDSLNILEIFSDQVRIKVNKENMGLGYSSNVGMSLARGRYVVRVDADDYVHSDFLRGILLGFEFFGEATEAISTDYLKVTPEGIYISYGSALLDPIACSIAFKIDALEELGFYNDTLRIHEEVDLRERFNSRGFSMRNINLPLYRYVQHSSSLTKTVIR